MISILNKSQLGHSLLGLCLLMTAFSADAAFFDDASSIAAANTPDVTTTVLKRSATSPDGRFTYVSGLGEIFIFSRDAATGSLTQTEIFSAASYPGGKAGANIAPDDLIISPDGNHLYMAGPFGWQSQEGGAPIPWQTTVVKFDRDSESGALTYNNFLDMGQQFAHCSCSGIGSIILTGLTTPASIKSKSWKFVFNG